MSGGQLNKRRVGVVRSSQLMYTYGVGSTVDLSNFSVVVKGIESWRNNNHQEEIVEPRLLGSLHESGLVDRSVTSLYRPPWVEETTNAESRLGLIGVPVSTFPRWFRCSNSKCNYLGKIDSEQFILESNVNDLTKNRYVHKCSGSRKAWNAIPSRFVVACSNGHLDEFPWIEFCHLGTAICDSPRLTHRDTGAADRSTSVIVTCVNCDANRSLAVAFSQSGRDQMPRCRGRHPHLGAFVEDCKLKVSPILMGASNLWFPVSRSAISIPSGGTELDDVVSRNIDILRKVDSEVFLTTLIMAVSDLRVLGNYPSAEVFEAIRRIDNREVRLELDLLGPEWKTISLGDKALRTRDFHCEDEPSPNSSYFDATILVKRLRAVTAFVGFTRVEAIDLEGSSEVEEKKRLVRVARNNTSWIPANEHHGEGILIRFKDNKIAEWEQRSMERGLQFQEGLDLWHRQRGINPRQWLGLKFLLIHSFSHMLINALAIECGYSAASLKERIYASDSANGNEAMAGVLIYTAANDSEGTLGGLIEQGRRDRLNDIIENALRTASLCSSDPLCIHHEPGTNIDPLNGAVCHACLLLPETSCSHGNRFLDRATLVETLIGSKYAFFTSHG